MAGNPNPSRITDALWYFRTQCLAIEPGTEDGGIYAPKYQYHDTRDHIVANKGSDYSTTLADDKAGPGDKAAAFDWTFPDAQSGRYGTIVKYGQRIKGAYERRDLRLHGWREVLIQADYDESAEGFDFVGWYTRTPDSTHLWHGHFSVLRRYVNDMAVMNGMLSILSGEDLSTWQAGRSRYGGTGVEDDVLEGDDKRRLFNTEELKLDAVLNLTPEYSYVPWGGDTNPSAPRNKAPNKLAATLAEIKAALDAPVEIELPADFADQVAQRVVAQMGDALASAIADKLAARLKD